MFWIPVPGENGGTTTTIETDGYPYTEPFLDTDRITISGVTQSVNTPTKDASNPLFPTSADTGEWDEDKLFVSATKNADGWHMHYKGWDGTTQHFGYASSVDGDAWTKPSLGLVSYGGDTDNNILLQAHFTHGHYDALSDKWVATTEIPAFPGTDLKIYTSDEPDGTFTLVKTLTGAQSNSEVKAVIRRPSDGRWVLYYVAGHGTDARSIYAVVSDTQDLTGDWTEYGLILSSPGSTNQYYSIGPTEIDGVLYGLVSRYNSTAEQVWTDLFLSLNGIDWTQADANWIDVGTAGAWDDELAAFAGRLVEDGDDWHVYYSGSAENHAASFPRDSRIGRASVTRGRLGQVSGTGTVTTDYIHVAPGAVLTVNADASGGTLDIEVQDENGDAITGFATADFDTISTDSLDHYPTWDQVTLPAGTVRLKFTLSSATLHSFTITDAASAFAVANDGGGHLGIDTHANRPAAGDVPAGSLYSCSDHSLIYKSDGSTWATWATLGGGGGSGGANSGARISDPAGADQAVTALTVTVVTFDTEDFDTDSYATLGTNNDRLTVTDAGLYLIGGTIGFNADTGWNDVRIYLNGTTTLLAANRVELDAAVEVLISVSTLWQASANDFFHLVGVSQNGADIFHKAYAPNLWIAKL